MGVLVRVICILLILLGVAAVAVVLGLLYSVYLSIPYDEWVKMQKKTETEKKEEDEGVR